MNLWIVKIVSSGLGIGLIPMAPGTWASCCSVLLCYLLLENIEDIYIRVIMVIIALGCALITAVIYKHIVKVYNDSDPKEFVLDELSAQSVVLAALPVLKVKFLLGGLILFRFFDILKPPPIRWSERLDTRFAIILDDLIAGIYTIVIIWSFYYLRLI